MLAKKQPLVKQSIASVDEASRSPYFLERATTSMIYVVTKRILRKRPYVHMICSTGSYLCVFEFHGDKNEREYLERVLQHKILSPVIQKDIGNRHI